MKLKFILLSATVGIVSLLNSCINKDDLPKKLADLNVTTGLPLIRSTVSMADLVSTKDTNFHLNTNSEGYYTMVFDQLGQNSPTAETYIKLKDQLISNIAPVPFPSGSTGVAATFNVLVNFNDPSTNYLNGAKLKNIFLKQGSLSLQLTSTVNNAVDVTISFPTILEKVGNVFSKPAQLTYRLTKDIATSKAILFTDHVMNFPNSGLIPVAITISGTGSGLDELKINSFNLSNLKWSRIEGKLGSFTLPIIDEGKIPIQESITLSPFNNNPTSDTDTSKVYVHFENPILKLKLQNSFGLTTSLRLDPLKAVNKTGAVTRVTSTPPFILARPLADPGLGQPASIAITTAQIATETKTINQVLATGPKELIYGLMMIVDSNQTLITDYILSDSKIGAVATLELPLYGYMKNLSIVDNVDLDLSGEKEVSNTQSSSDASITLNYATFKLLYESEFPAEVSLQVKFLDINGNTVDKLFDGVDGVVLPSAEVDANGVVKAKSPTKYIEQKIDKARYDKIKAKTKKVGFAVVFNTTNAQSGKNIKIFPENNLTLQLSVYGNALVKFK